MKIEAAGAVVRKTVSFQAIIFGPQPATQTTLAAEGAALFRPTLAVTLLAASDLKLCAKYAGLCK